MLGRQPLAIHNRAPMSEGAKDWSASESWSGASMSPSLTVATALRHFLRRD